MAKQRTLPFGAAVCGAVALVAALLYAGRYQYNGHFIQMLDGVIHEDLVSLREFVRRPTLSMLKAGLREFWDIIGPGGRLHPGWFLEHKGHLVIEGLLMIIIAVMLLQSRFYPRATEDDDSLTEKASRSSATTQSAAEAHLHSLLAPSQQRKQRGAQAFSKAYHAGC
eukprot:GHUV01024771.1.p1 GENE.GHUV01024771.1~~GHUV01024771.1.p1  ORF type:complete len:167 (+),score=34.95 GHUV01024771.1:630-1130(+)